MGKTIAISNLKGGTGKSVTSVNLGIGLARQGQRVLLIDGDSQHSLSVSLGVAEPEKLTVTLSTIMTNIISDLDYEPNAGIITHKEGVDLLPSNLSLANTELMLVSAIGREPILRQYIEKVKKLYDYIIVDTAPTLGLLTINSLAAADCVLIPVVPKYLDAKGLELLLKTISQLRKQINPNLSISGILMTMVDRRANFTKEIISLIKGTYGEHIRIFSEHIPHSVRAAEASATGKSIFKHDPNGKVAAAYAVLTREVLNDE
jgi:chromosome partitioning protein